MQTTIRITAPILIVLLLGCEFEPGQGNVPPVADENAATFLSHVERRNLADGPGGFVNNPENSRGTLKLVFPAAYSDRIEQVRVYTAEGELFDTLYRQTPDEHGNRQRYYGTRPIEDYPDNLHVLVTLLEPKPDGTTAESHFVFVLPDPQRRMD
ncbi:MAG: hypothetical protein N2652_05975 [Kiritimatiellae bacterium]|nr:hypothetical protein [Kiritimatiellia bacterium]